VIKQRFGETACRLFRLLLNNPQLEQKQISELAMIPTKDCREILGKLLKQEYVRLQEVARTTDHAPSRTNYLWRVHLPSVIVRIQLELQATYHNLESRLHDELRKEKVLSCAGTLQACVNSRDPSETFPSFGRRGPRTSVEKLELSLLRLDKMMIVFSS
jgi:DNA-directed RNA polymerase III subunit RPC3